MSLQYRLSLVKIAEVKRAGRRLSRCIASNLGACCWQASTQLLRSTAVE